MAKQTKQNKSVPILSPMQLEELLKTLDSINPVYQALPPSATIEHRGLHQCRIQEFHSIVEKIKHISTGLKLSEIETTYGAEKEQ